MESKSKAVSKLLAKVEKKLTGTDMKASLGDYVRLVQLQKELEEDEVREITVTWVDPEMEAREAVKAEAKGKAEPKAKAKPKRKRPTRVSKK
jgi:hypothetical protein